MSCGHRLPQTSWNAFREKNKHADDCMFRYSQGRRQTRRYSIPHRVRLEGLPWAIMQVSKFPSFYAACLRVSQAGEAKLLIWRPSIICTASNFDFSVRCLSSRFFLLRACTRLPRKTGLWTTLCGVPAVLYANVNLHWDGT